MTAPIIEQHLTIQERWELLEKTKPDVFQAYKEACEDVTPSAKIIDHSTPIEQYTAEEIANTVGWLDQHGIPRTRLAA